MANSLREDFIVALRAEEAAEKQAHELAAAERLRAEKIQKEKDQIEEREKIQRLSGILMKEAAGLKEKIRAVIKDGKSTTKKSTIDMPIAFTDLYQIDCEGIRETAGYKQLLAVCADPAVDVCVELSRTWRHYPTKLSELSGRFEQDYSKPPILIHGHFFIDMSRPFSESTDAPKKPSPLPVQRHKFLHIF